MVVRKAQLSICGEAYSLMTDEHDELLHRIVQTLETRMNRLSHDGASAVDSHSLYRRAVMSAIQALRDCEYARSAQSAYEDHIVKLCQTIDHALANHYIL